MNTKSHNPDSLHGKQNINFMTIGIVEDTNDPGQMGRIKVYCPSIDNENHTVADLPWTQYASPFGGVTMNNVAGPEGDISYGPHAYGMWAIPKQGATVLVMFINGNTNFRVYTHCIFPTMGNRGLPGGRGVDNTTPALKKGPFTDSHEDIQPAKRNQSEAGLDSAHYFSRGGYERQIAQAVTDKDGSEGYAKNPNKTNPTDLDSQGYCIVTPGRHFISMQDAPDFCRVRVKTTTGHQIILDDTNERIYVSTNKGNSWLEMDTDGHIHFYGSESISFTSGADFNVTANNINLAAKSSVNIHSGSVAITSGTNIQLNSGCSTLITAGDTIEFGAEGDTVIAGSKIHLNSKPATVAATASTPGITPAHEPFNRPTGKSTRNKHWRP